MKFSFLYFARVSIAFFLPLLAYNTATAQWTGTTSIVTANTAASVGIGIATGTSPSARLQIVNGDIHLTSTAYNAGNGFRTLSTNSDAGTLVLTPRGTAGTNSSPDITIFGKDNGWRGGTMYFKTFSSSALAPAWGMCYSFNNYNAYLNQSTELMNIIEKDGKARVTIGSGMNLPGDYGLYVERGILTERVRVAIKNSGAWADYVFAPEYKLASLSDVELFIKANKHLPGVPSADEVVKEGVDAAQMDAKLLEKIEELTLYLIAQEKKIALLEAVLKRAETGAK